MSWQSAALARQRFVGALGRELLDHVIVLGERHLLRLVQEHARYCNEDRPHRVLDGDAPVSCAVEVPGSGRQAADESLRWLALVASVIATRGLNE